jgi:hypothetical protein
MNKEQIIKQLELKQLELQREIEALKKKSELPSEWSDELRKYNMGVYVDDKYFKQFVALDKLIILRDIYRESEDEKVDWSDGEQNKYCIVNLKENIQIDLFLTTRRILSFTKKETRDLFLKNFKSLIIEAKELL